LLPLSQAPGQRADNGPPHFLPSAVSTAGRMGRQFGRELEFLLFSFTTYYFRFLAIRKDLI
jgi:hypothetical protein